MAVNLRLYTVLVLLTFFSCLPVDMVAALPAMPHYTIGLWANGGLSSHLDVALHNTVIPVLSLASATAMHASVATTNSAESATFTITVTTTPLATEFSTSMPAPSSYITEGVFYSSAASGEPARSRNVHMVVGIIMACIAGGLFLAATGKYLACWACNVLHGNDQNQPTAADVEANAEEEITTSDRSTVPHSDMSDASSATMVNSTITSSTTAKSKKRFGMVIDMSQCHWLAEQDITAANISPTAKGMAKLTPCLSPLTPMSPFLVFDIVQRKAEIAAAEKQKARQDAYLKLNGDA